MPLPLLPILAGAAAVFFLTRKSDSTGGSGGAGGTSTIPGCEGVPRSLPAPPAGDTGFDALPKTPLADLGGQSYYDFFFESMKLTPTSPNMNRITQEAAAIGCEEKAKILRCNGYTKAADMLIQQAAEIRQWKL